jgi:hypothetical protein
MDTRDCPDYEMKWILAEKQKPDNNGEVLVSDGYGGFGVAWWSAAGDNWELCTDMIDGNSGEEECLFVKWWTPITEPS